MMMKKTILLLVLATALLSGCGAADDKQLGAELARAMGAVGDFTVVEGLAYNFNEGVTTFYDEVNGVQLQGYKDITGATVLAGSYTDARSFSEGLAFVKQHWLELGGYIDRTGRYIIPPMFSGGSEFNNGKAVVYFHDGSNIINKSGELLLPRNYNTIHYHEQIAKYECRDYDGYIHILNEELKVEKRYNYMQYSFTVIDGQTYVLYVDYADNGGVIHYDSDRVVLSAGKSYGIRYEKGVFISYYQDKASVFDIQGKLLASFTDSEVASLSEDIYYVVNWVVGERYILEQGVRRDVDFLAERAISPTHHAVYRFYEEPERNAYGVMDHRGELVIQVEYDYIVGHQYGDSDRKSSKEVIIAGKDGRIYVFDQTGTPIKDFVGTLVGEIDNEVYVLVYRDPKNIYHFLDQDLNDKATIKSRYELSVSDYGEIGFITAFTDDKYQEYAVIRNNDPRINVREYEPMTPAKIQIPTPYRVERNAYFLEGSNKKLTAQGVEFLVYGKDFHATLQVIDNELMFPVRALGDSLGIYNVYGSSWEIFLPSMDRAIMFNTNAPTAATVYFDETVGAYVFNEIPLAYPARNIEGLDYVPLSVVAEALDFSVYRDQATGVVGVGTGLTGLSPEQGAYLAREFSKELVTIQELQRMDASLATQPYLNYISSLLLGFDQQVENVADYSNTIPAYERLINGEKDLILVTEPSPEIIAQAQQRGVELDLTPFSKEGFVFLVNTENPIKSLTQAQLRDIYQGKTVNWKEVGGEDLAITAYQRNEGSGSQTIMENVFMAGLQMPEPVTERIMSMEGLIEVVAEFRDDVNGGIGYSVYYYAQEMMGNPNTRIIAVDGVLPSNQYFRRFGLDSCSKPQRRWRL